MNVKKNIKALIDSQEFLAYLISLVLSTFLLGYAINSIALGVFIFFSIRYYFIRRDKIKIEFTLVLPILLYLLFFLTIFWTANQSKTIIGLERTIALFLVPSAFIVIPKFSSENISIIFKYFTVSNLLLATFFLTASAIRYFKTNNLEVFRYHDLVSVLKLNAIYVSLIFSLSLFYLLSKTRKTLIDKFAFIYLLIFIVLLSSKTMLFILLVGFIIYIFLNGIRQLSRIKLLLITITTLLIVGISSFTIVERIAFEKKVKFNEILTKEKFGKVYPWTGSSIRLLQLRILKEQIQEESILIKGFGLFASRDNIRLRHQKFNIYEGFHDYNYHNQYAQILSETGIFGLILLIAILLFSFINALKSREFLFLMFCFSFSLMFFTESLLWRQKGLFLFVILFCLFNRTFFKEQQNL